MIWAFEVETVDPAFAGRFFQAALARGLVLRPLGNTVYFMPPYIISEREMDLLVAGTLQALDAY
jgi:adenosylmethionine-8-amino-7-oxononanoate aminotransferase